MEVTYWTLSEQFAKHNWRSRNRTVRSAMEITHKKNLIDALNRETFPFEFLKTVQDRWHGTTRIKSVDEGSDVIVNFGSASTFLADNTRFNGDVTFSVHRGKFRFFSEYVIRESGRLPGIPHASEDGLRSHWRNNQDSSFANKMFVTKIEL